jgi:hypothetical protein
MIEQASAQQNNVTGLDKQVAQKIAEADEIEAAIAKLEASLPFLIRSQRRWLSNSTTRSLTHVDA